ncbi:hypothetical protein CTheo_1564 [Ceratobasidium theobromae]|uniref:Tropomyosin n=1 Tax=Ceratobasidium theobromae TaxID=1582974 RepID=A0A5N5QTN2_9AGAM|nr:hypothetical protein CTheo_1564 [Ceratobasidium theobromae]
MDRIKQRMETLRQEADAATERAEKAEAKLKTTEQELLNREQECQSLKHQLSVRDNELEDTESKLKEAKAAGMAGESNLASVNALQSKIQLLEEELDVAERNAKETMEKLRQVDVKAEHFERHLQKVEQERDSWEKKYEVCCSAHLTDRNRSLSQKEAMEKYKKSQKELDELAMGLENL